MRRRATGGSRKRVKEAEIYVAAGSAWQVKYSREKDKIRRRNTNERERERDMERGKREKERRKESGIRK